jgi:hypothetical protein
MMLSGHKVVEKNLVKEKPEQTKTKKNMIGRSTKTVRMSREKEEEEKGINCLWSSVEGK